MRYAISKAERILGISQSSLRRYEDAGLLSIRRMPESKYRYFSTGDIARLSVFLGMRQQDFLPQELGKIARREDDQAHVYHRLAEIDAEMEKLRAEKICWEKHLKLFELMLELKRMPEGGKLIRHEAMIGSYFRDEQSMYDALYFQMFRSGDLQRNYFRLCCFYAQESGQENMPCYCQAYCAPLELIEREDILNIKNKVYLAEREYIAAYALNLSIIDEEKPGAVMEAVEKIQSRISKLLGDFQRKQDGDAMTMTVTISKDKHEAILFIPVIPDA